MVNEISGNTFISDTILSLRNIMHENIIDTFNAYIITSGTTTLNIDVTGRYESYGTNDGRRMFRNQGATKNLLWYNSGSNRYFVGSAIDDTSGYYDTTPGFQPNGPYAPFGGAVGSPVVDNKARSVGKFVYSAYPRNPSGVQYPIITVKDAGISTIRHLGMQSEQTAMSFPVEIRVWARNTKERDQISQDVYSYFQGNQFGTGSTTRNLGLHDFKMTSMINVDEPGEEGVKSKVMEYEYLYLNQ